MTKHRRVVITGLGAVTPLGLSIDTTWERMQRGESGVKPITLFDTTGLAVNIAGEVSDFNADNYMDRKQARRTSRSAHLALAAAQAAVKDAQLDLPRTDRTRLGVAVGAGLPGFDRQVEGVLHVATGAAKGNPFLMVSSLGNMPAAIIAAEFGAQGPTSTIVTACASSVQSIGEAAETIRRGWTDVMIAGGTDALMLRASFVAFDSIGALARTTGEPHKACRPFENSRDGTVLAEGSAMVILEELEHAVQRGAPIYAEVTGFAVSSDNFSLFESDPTGQSAAQTMTWALQRAGLQPADIDYIAAHGTATRANDVVETRGIKLAFGEAAYTVPASSVKSMIGHTLGASGAIGVTVTIKAMHAGCVPPTINLDTPDPECDLDYVPHTARAAQVDRALVNAFGFGGQNACLVLDKTNIPIS